MATEADTPNAGALTTFVLAGTFALVAIVGVVTAVVRTEVDAVREASGGAAKTSEYRTLRASQEAELKAAPKLVDAAKGIAAIPIDLAMKLVVAEFGKAPVPASAAPAEASAAPSASTSASAEPAGSASAAPSGSAPVTPAASGVTPAPSGEAHGHGSH